MQQRENPKGHTRIYILLKQSQEVVRNEEPQPFVFQSAFNSNRCSEFKHVQMLAGMKDVLS